IKDAIEEGEKIKDVSFDEKNLTIKVDISKTDTSVLTAKEIGEMRISSITDEILALDDKYYNTWETITIDFGKEGKAVCDKSMVKDEGFGKFFDIPIGILE
ncbi:MAG: hypothetical protein K6G65_08120, partial [Lachnospiraceae bacterium]|nr:hypothetical protein [Lachnospiraceae bacterium]